MSTAWTAERRRKQALLMKTIQPWKLSTGPKTDQGKANSARNAFKGGYRQQMKNLRKLFKDQHTFLKDL